MGNTPCLPHTAALGFEGFFCCHLGLFKSFSIYYFTQRGRNCSIQSGNISEMSFTSPQHCSEIFPSPLFRVSANKEPELPGCSLEKPAGSHRSCVWRHTEVESSAERPFYHSNSIKGVKSQNPENSAPAGEVSMLEFIAYNWWVLKIPKTTQSWGWSGFKGKGNLNFVTY